MLTHVYQFSSLLYTLKGSFHYGFRAADECDDSTVCGFSRIYIQNLYSTGFLNRRNDSVDYFHVTAFAEIRHALDDSFHISVYSFMNFQTIFKG